MKLVQRFLDQYFFDPMPEGPRPVSGEEIDVEIVARWLTQNRHRVVASTRPTLRTSEEVIDRLRWFVEHGGLIDPDDPRLSH